MTEQDFKAWGAAQLRRHGDMHSLTELQPVLSAMVYTAERHFCCLAHATEQIAEYDKAKFFQWVRLAQVLHSFWVVNDPTAVFMNKMMNDLVATGKANKFQAWATVNEFVTRMTVNGVDVASLNTVVLDLDTPEGQAYMEAQGNTLQ